MRPLPKEPSALSSHAAGCSSSRCLASWPGMRPQAPPSPFGLKWNCEQVLLAVGLEHMRSGYVSGMGLSTCANEEQIHLFTFRALNLVFKNKIDVIVVSKGFSQKIYYIPIYQDIPDAENSKLKSRKPPIVTSRMLASSRFDPNQKWKQTQPMPGFHLDRKNLISLNRLRTGLKDALTLPLSLEYGPCNKEPEKGPHRYFIRILALLQIEMCIMI
nr:unnamed protein product [Callosobruchus analis]